MMKRHFTIASESIRGELTLSETCCTEAADKDENPVGNERISPRDAHMTWSSCPGCKQWYNTLVYHPQSSSWTGNTAAHFTLPCSEWSPARLVTMGGARWHQPH